MTKKNPREAEKNGFHLHRNARHDPRHSVALSGRQLMISTARQKIHRNRRRPRSGHLERIGQPNWACWARPLTKSMAALVAAHLENALLMEEFGKVIAIEPYLQTVVIGGGALKAVGGAQAAMRIIPGHHRRAKAIIAFAYAEPQGRYDLANIRTTAKADGSGYVLNGHKGVVYCAPLGNPPARHSARTGGSTREREWCRAVPDSTPTCPASPAATIRLSMATALLKSISKMSRSRAIRTARGRDRSDRPRG